MPLRSVILADLNFGRCAICATRPATVGTRVRLYLDSPKTAFALPTVSWLFLCLFSSHSHTPRRRRSFSLLGAIYQTSASFQRLRTADGEVDGSSHLRLPKRSYGTPASSRCWLSLIQALLALPGGSLSPVEFALYKL